jgi:ribosomal protein S18 acetylase RimI-like enzyme
MSNQPIPAVQLHPMSMGEYEIWRLESIESYAREKVAAGQFPAERALKMSEEAFNSLLPAGLGTPDQFLFSARTPEQSSIVGFLWLNVRPAPDHSSYIFDIVVSPEFRGKGFGRAILTGAEDFARAKGAKSIGLNVFGHNQIARSLYESSGYSVSSLNMRKSLT